MNFPKVMPVTGSLLGVKSGSDKILWDHLDGVEVEPLRRRKRWSCLTLSSESPLLNESSSSADSTGPFVYYFLLRTYGDHLILLGQENAIVDILIDMHDLRRRLFCPSVGIASLVNDFVALPKEDYVISAVYARVEGHGQRLRSMVLYGADVTESELFKGILSDLQPYRVGFRDNTHGQEIMSIGSRGETSLVFSGTDSLKRVDFALKFLSSGGYIDWDRPLAVSLR